MIVGTRGSRLALAQTDWVIEALIENNPSLKIEKKIISTKGDEILNVSLDKIGDKGLFVKELEMQLLSGEIDFAVHSMKDMPSLCTTGLSFAKTPHREDPRDILILRAGLTGLKDLPIGARIGTGSKRRLFQLLTVRPDLIAVPVRGNIETRIKKIETEKLDGVILAAAGIHRLNLNHLITEYLSLDLMLPAPAQGALGIQYRTDDFQLGKLLNALVDAEADICVKAERSFLEHIEGSCHIPIGAFATLSKDVLTLKCVFGDSEGMALYFETLTGNRSCPEDLGKKAAQAIINKIRNEENHDVLNR